MDLGKRTFLSETQVIWAIIMKQLRIESRYRIDFLIETIFPLTIISDMAHRIFEGLTFGPTEGLQQYIGMRDYATFAMISVVLWEQYRRLITGPRVNVRNEQMSGTLEAAYTCPVKRPILLAGFCLSSLITFLPSMGALFLSAFVMGARLSTTPLNVVSALMFFIAGVGGCFGLSFVLAGLVVKYREPGITEGLLLHTLVYISAIYYPLTSLPLIARAVAYFNPTAYAIDGVRSLLLGSSTVFPIAYEFLVMAAFTVLLTLIGLLIYYKLEKSVMKKEGIGAY